MLVVYYFIMYTFYSMATQGTRPIISLFAYHSGASEALIGVLVSVYALMPMLFAIRIGKWLDRFGARTVTLWGGSGMFVAIAVPCVYPTIPALFFSQLLLGFGLLCVLVSLQKTVGNLPGDRDRLIATISLSGSLGEFIGPSIYTFLYEHYGFSASFSVAGVCVALSVLMGWFASKSVWKSGAPGTGAKTGGAAQTGSTWGLLRSVSLRNALIISALVLYSKDLFIAYFPIYATNLGISASRIGMILSCLAAMMIVVRFAQFHLVQRFGRTKLFFSTLLLSGVCFLVVPFFHAPLLLAGLAMLIGAGLGLGQPLSLVFAMNTSPEGRQGEVLGMRLTFNRASQFGAPMLFGALGTVAGLSPVFWLSGGVLLFGAFATRERAAAPPTDSAVGGAG